MILFAIKVLLIMISKKVIVGYVKIYFKSIFQRTNKEMDNLLDQGREMLNSLVDQRNMIKVRENETLLVFIHVLKFYLTQMHSFYEYKSIINFQGFRRKMLDVASVLGLSNTVMRHIEKRSEGDKWILFGGMFLTCVIMFFVIRWFT